MIVFCFVVYELEQAFKFFKRWYERVRVLIEIREERPDDDAAVREVNKLAFGQDQESNIVDALRANGGTLLSLVATVNDQVAGHVMYNALTTAENVGTKLIKAGNRKIKDAGYPFIMVVGHAEYYQRF